MTRQDILEILGRVRHPGIGDRSVVELGMVDSVEMDGKRVCVTLAFPKRRDPLTEYLVGSTARARAFSMKLGVNMAIVDKRRERANQSEVMNIIGDVSGKTCILLDDIVDTAGSIVGAAKAIKEIGGAKEVYACATHGVLSGPALDRINSSCIKEMLLLDTIPYPANRAKCEKIAYLSTASVFAEAIRRIYEEVSISNLFDT